METTEIKKTKVCVKCGRELPIESFSPNMKNKDGYRNECKECAAAYQKERYQKMKEGLIAPKYQRSSKCSKVFSNPELAKFTPRQLIEELKMRGYKGSLTYEMKIEL